MMTAKEIAALRRSAEAFAHVEDMPLMTPREALRLLDTIEHLKNDLADSLDLRNGVGPTVLTALVSERDALRSQLSEYQAQRSEEWMRDTSIRVADALYNRWYEGDVRTTDAIILAVLRERMGAK